MYNGQITSADDIKKILHEFEGDLLSQVDKDLVLAWLSKFYKYGSCSSSDNHSRFQSWKRVIVDSGQGIERYQNLVSLYAIFKMSKGAITQEEWLETEKYAAYFVNDDSWAYMQTQQNRSMLSLGVAFIAGVLAYLSFMTLGSVVALNYTLSALFSSIAVLSVSDYVFPAKLPASISPSKVVLGYVSTPQKGVSNMLASGLSLNISA